MHKIVASQITEMKVFQLDRRPVFRLQFRDGTALVIKAAFYNGLQSRGGRRGFRQQRSLGRENDATSDS